MNIKQYILISASCFTLGLLLFAIHQKWIIINLPSTQKNIAMVSTTHKKNCRLFYFHNNKWHTETSMLIWSENSADNLSLLVNQWLSLLHEEKIIKKKTILESACVSEHQELLLSFDRTLFGKEATTHEKLMIVESLLKTIRENEPTIKKVRILVAHQALPDYHLNFTNPWPIQGFVG
jgi:hypothetical protein